MVKIMNVLAESEINKNLTELDNWSLDGDAIRKKWEFKNFSEAMDFINMMAVIAEKHDHHPQLFNVYNRVPQYKYIASGHQCIQPGYLTF